MNYKIIAEEIFKSAIESVLPDKMIRHNVRLKGNLLHIAESIYNLNEISNIYVIGAGKASGLMALELENILGSRVTEGLVIVKYGHLCNTKIITLLEAGHPIPDNNGFIASEKLMGIAQKANAEDLVICLISGGGSALLTDFPEGSKAEDIIELNQQLIDSGASIHEINVVRKHLSNIKGGQLAKAVYPAKLACLVLSDVVGDNLDVIASGPTVADDSSFMNAWQVIQKHNLLTLPQNLLNRIKEGIKGNIAETPKPDDPIFTNLTNTIVGNNKVALRAALKTAISKGLDAIIVDADLCGETIEEVEFVVQTAINAQTDDSLQKPLCLLFGGETTLLVEGEGVGGRNQHAAMFAAMMLKDRKGITFLSAGTDGTDGPTDAAGAVVDYSTLKQALAKKIDIVGRFKDFDSYHFFKQVGGHIITGPTKTNVMDIMVVIVA